MAWPSGKTLGGSSVLNGLVVVRGNRKNYDRWAAEGAKGWSYEDVLPYFKKMEDNRDPEYVANGMHMNVNVFIRNFLEITSKIPHPIKWML